METSLAVIVPHKSRFNFCWGTCGPPDPNNRCVAPHVDSEHQWHTKSKKRGVAEGQSEIVETTEPMGNTSKGPGVEAYRGGGSNIESAAEDLPVRSPLCYSAENTLSARLRFLDAVVLLKFIIPPWRREHVLVNIFPLWFMDYSQSSIQKRVLISF